MNAVYSQPLAIHVFDTRKDKQDSDFFILINNFSTNNIIFPKKNTDDQSYFDVLEFYMANKKNHTLVSISIQVKIEG